MPWLFAYGHFLTLIPEDADPGPERARLKGYRAAFAARSTVDWGTRANPAPVLALVSGGGSCRGLALEVPAERLDETLASWAGGDGPDQSATGEAELGLPFRRDPAQVRLLTVEAKGPAALAPLPVERLARMAVVARGRRGTGVDYLRIVDECVRKWGLEEPVLSALWKEVQKERGEGWR